MAQKKEQTNVIDRIKAHYDAQGLREIRVPEWGDDDGPLIIFAAPFTLRDQARIDFASRNSESQIDALCEVLVQKALAEDGSKMFNAGDKKALREHADIEVISRICTEIMGSKTEELEKN